VPPQHTLTGVVAVLAGGSAQGGGVPLVVRLYVIYIISKND
jgi:hypothetical protein